MKKNIRLFFTALCMSLFTYAVPLSVFALDPVGESITSELWIGAVINTEEKGPVEAVWLKGGEDTTGRGDQVIWGHFYASSSDVSWGSEDNPELFVKIWVDVSGRVDVNFFHVSVPDIEVYSRLPDQGVYDQKGTATMADRYIRHEYGSSSCDSSNLDLCADSYACSNAGGYWYNNTCNGNLTMDMLAGTYDLKTFTIIYDAGVTLTEDNFSNFSGTMKITTDGTMVQTFNIEGESGSLSGDIGLLDNDTLKIFSSGYAYNIEFSFIDNVLTTNLESGAFPGLEFSETDVWEKISSFSGNTYSLSAPSGIGPLDASSDDLNRDNSELNKLQEVLGERAVGAGVGNLLD